MRYLLLIVVTIYLSSCSSPEVETLMAENEKLRQEVRNLSKVCKESSMHVQEAEAKAILALGQVEEERSKAQAAAASAKKALAECQGK